MGVAELHLDQQLLTIYARLFFYGDAAFPMLCKDVAQEIQITWNEPRARVMIQQVSYTVQFKIEAIYAPALQPEDVMANTNPENNYFRIEEYSANDISFVDGLNSNTGYFKLANLLNNSTTAAHEFGHTLGLDHPEILDIRGSGVPGIMYPRGSLVDPQFQYDPNIAAGQKGGTINPLHRKVLQQDIDNLQLNKLNFSNNKKAVVGAFTSVWHQKHLPNHD